MEIKEKIADLFYILNDIQQSTDNDRIAMLADGMQLTIMEMDALSRGNAPKPETFPAHTILLIRDDTI
jgi:hypothetical protein